MKNEIKLIKSKSNGNTTVNIYECPCGKSIIKEENDYTPGHRDNFTTILCPQCNKKYFIDYGNSTINWKLKKKPSIPLVDLSTHKVINYFMQVYLYELENFLNTKKDELKNVSFQSDEANTDRPLKEYLKHLIESSFRTIPSNSSIKFIDSLNSGKFSTDTLKNIVINKVLLPEEISENIKTIIKESKKSVFTNPDLCLELKINNTSYYETIELKSTKQDAIPGSSIQQILPNEWVIFILHTNNTISVSTGQYIHSINSKMQFPDRSPRPQVSFKELNNWNKLNRLYNDDTLIYNKDLDDSIKQELIDDWQNVLANRWIDLLFNATKVKRNEPWFNNNMRKFIILFLNKYEKLNDQEKEQFKLQVQKLITDK